MSKFNTGDKITSLVYGEFYGNRHVGVVIKDHGSDCFVDFNGHGNDFVVGDGRWFIECRDMELVK